MLPNLLVTTVILLLVTMSDFSHKYNIASKKWMEPFTDLLQCLFDHMHCSTPDLPVAHIIRELALCRDDNSTFLLTSVEMSQIIQYLCTIYVLENYS